jgi:hypothetical protein
MLGIIGEREDGSLDTQRVGGANRWLLRARALISGPEIDPVATRLTVR